MNHGEPGVQPLRESDQPLGLRWEGLDDALVQPYPDGHLNEHGAKASQGVDPVALVKGHGLLGQPGLIIGIFLL